MTASHGFPLFQLPHFFLVPRALKSSSASSPTKSFILTKGSGSGITSTLPSRLTWSERIHIEHVFAFPEELLNRAEEAGLVERPLIDFPQKTDESRGDQDPQSCRRELRAPKPRRLRQHFQGRRLAIVFCAFLVCPIARDILTHGNSSLIFGGNKGAIRIPFLSFQFLRRPGCTAKLLCFHITSGFDPHRPYQTSRNKRLSLC
jgi:hypothetical protein